MEDKRLKPVGFDSEMADLLDRGTFPFIADKDLLGTIFVLVNISGLGWLLAVFEIVRPAAETTLVGRLGEAKGTEVVALLQEVDIVEVKEIDDDFVAGC